MKSCRDCAFFRAPPVVIIGGDPGRCAYIPPPIVAQLYGMLAAEPNTHINYAEVFGDDVAPMKSGICSEFKPKGDAK